MLNSNLLRLKLPVAATTDATAPAVGGQCWQQLAAPQRLESQSLTRRRLLTFLGLGGGIQAFSPSVVCWGDEPRQWLFELQVGRFTIHADFDVATLADLPLELTGLTGDVSSVLGIEATHQPVHVVLFASASEYQRYMRNYFPQLPERRALFIQDRGPGMLFAHWHADIASDVRHEVTHALLNDSSRPLPLWLDEGLAKYFEAERSRRFDGHAYLQEVSQRASRGIVPTLQPLEAADQLSEFKEPHYRDSWAWVHFLIHRSAATRELLQRALAQHRSGADPLPLSRQLDLLSREISSEFLAHFRAFERPS